MTTATISTANFNGASAGAREYLDQALAELAKVGFDRTQQVIAYVSDNRDPVRSYRIHVMDRGWRKCSWPTPGDITFTPDGSPVDEAVLSDLDTLRGRRSGWHLADTRLVLDLFRALTR